MGKNRKYLRKNAQAKTLKNMTIKILKNSIHFCIFDDINSSI